MRVVFLNQVVFKNKGLVVVSGDHVVDVSDLLHKGLGLSVSVGEKVLAYTASETLGFSNVDDVSAFILHQITARIQRKGVGLGLCRLEVCPPLFEFILCYLLVDLITQSDFECFFVHLFPDRAILTHRCTC